MHNTNDITIICADEAATLKCGKQFAAVLQPGITVQLHGDLGAGKTTFSRGVLQGLGHVGRVKSPTYTLVEIYPLASFTLYHYDLYRFTSDDEWEAAGFRDYFNSQTVCLIEWPEKAANVLPAADIHVNLSLFACGQVNGRQIQFSAGSAIGNSCLNRF